MITPNKFPTSITHLDQLQFNRKLNLREQYDQMEVLQSKPLHVAIPTGDKCNLQCVFCTDRSSTGKDGYKNLTFTNFLKYVEPIEGALLTQLYGWGEPFANRDYTLMFDYVIAHYPGTRIYISTNGVLLTDRWVEKILDYEKCLVNISLNASTASTYAQITKREHFERVIGNIRRLVEAKEKSNAIDLVVSLSFVAIQPNIHELYKFIQLSEQLRINYVIVQDLNILEERHRQLYLGENGDSTREIFLTALEYARGRGIYLDSFMHLPGEYFIQDRTCGAQIELPRDCRSTWEQDDDPLFFPQPGECYEPWQTFLVSQNGSVTTCCRARQVMGNLLEQSFDDIWNGDIYRAYRRSINSFRPPEPCAWCPVKTGYDIR